ncbi:MAG: pilus assembly protein [Lentisphaeria bacterium]|nr:pilus assembly protein [Lentisphaeria bacterium]NQZ70385.1 pilus assembly protein [Lentisphaeria bacterium]
MKFKLKKQRRGQATIETVIAVIILTLIFFGLFQLIQLFVVQYITQHSANLAARSYTVGFHSDIVRRRAKIGLIPASGHMEGGFDGLGPDSYSDNYGMYDVEKKLIPLYMVYEDENYQYENWEYMSIGVPSGEPENATLRVGFYDYPVPLLNSDPDKKKQKTNLMHLIFPEKLNISSESTMHNHAEYYLE